MLLHPAQWHLVHSCDNQEQLQQQQYIENGLPTVAADLPWFVTPQGMILVPVFIPNGQKPPLTLPMPSSLPYRWQLVNYHPQEPVLDLSHIVYVGPILTLEKEENCCPVIFCEQIGAPAPTLAVGPDQSGKWLFVYNTVEDVMTASRCVTENGKSLTYVTSMVMNLPKVPEL